MFDYMKSINGEDAERKVAEGFVETLNKEIPGMIEAVYRVQKKKFIMADVYDRIADTKMELSDEEQEKIADRVGEALSYEGETNPDLSHWENIDVQIEIAKNNL